MVTQCLFYTTINTTELNDSHYRKNLATAIYDYCLQVIFYIHINNLFIMLCIIAILTYLFLGLYLRYGSLIPRLSCAFHTASDKSCAEAWEQG